MIFRGQVGLGTGDRNTGVDTKSKRAAATFVSLCKTLPIDNGRKSGRYSPNLGREVVCFWV
jgi:hypothetical protein